MMTDFFAAAAEVRLKVHSGKTKVLFNGIGQKTAGSIECGTKKYIAESNIAIIVESPGNVWRLEEAGFHNSVCTFGAHLTDGQRFILDSSGALALIVLTDPDEAGRIALSDIKKSCGLTYSIYDPTIGDCDVADHEAIELKEKLSPILDKVRSDLGL